MVNRIYPSPVRNLALGICHDRQEQAKTDAGRKASTSEEARKISLGIKEYNEDSLLKVDKAFFSQEARAQRQLDAANNMAERFALDSLDNEFQMSGITYSFNEATLEKFIADSLAGKAASASFVAFELGKMIRGTIHNPDITVEERACARETALRHADYIAQNFFDDPGEAKLFLEGINRFADNDILREKGYIVFGNSDLAPVKSYLMSDLPENINWSEYARKLGYSSIHDVFESPEMLNAFFSALQENRQEWDEEIAKSFSANEANVADVIRRVKASLKEADVMNSMQRLLRAF